MDFNEVFLGYILPALGTALSGLLSWAVAEFIRWVKSKTNNQTLVNMLEEIAQAGNVAVQATYQTYVEGLKGTDLWTEEAQNKALNEAIRVMKEQLSEKAIKWIQDNHGNIEAYLINTIESSLFETKNK